MTDGGDSDADERTSDSLLSRGALTAGALAAGLTGGNVVAGGNDAGQQDGAGQQNDAVQQVDAVRQDDGDDFRAEGLVFTYDFRPGVPFRVLDRIQVSTTVEILSGPSGEGVPVISQPDDYEGYVVNYRMNEDGPGEFTLVFTEEMLERGERYQFGMESQVFSNDINLISAMLRSAPDTAAPAEATTTTETDDETTTQPVIVETEED